MALGSLGRSALVLIVATLLLLFGVAIVIISWPDPTIGSPGYVLPF